MTERDRAIARLLLTGAAIGVAWLALRVPVLRRAAWRGARAALFSGLPALLAREAQRAWRASAPSGAAPVGEDGPHTPAAVVPPGPFSRS